MERRVLLIGLVVLIGLSVLAVIFLYMPNMAARNRNLSEVAKLDKEIRDLKAMAAGIEQLRQKVVESEKQVAEFNARVARYDSLYRLVQEIIEDGRKTYRLDFSEIKPPSKDTLMLSGVTAPLVAIPYQLTVRGRYLDIGHFIESMDRFRYFVRVPEFEVVGRDDIRPFVEARLLINLYATKIAGARS
jgi:Tfp pilus assembly protein PilO